MSKKSIRILSTLLTTVIVLMALTSSAFALSSPADLGNITANSTNATNSIAQAGANIIDIISTVAMVVAVIVLMILGVKYMMGSSEEKASYKKTMMPYIIGAILVFAAGTIATMVFDFANKL